uniref:Putative hydroquinone glucosyltransferase n=1 Tax=Aegilops tauschii TaxID=37682 RepID=R7WDN2_AEGTA
MDAGSSSSPLRIVIVPWLAFGHLLPYLELSERLAERGHRVSYVSTPRNLARLPLPLRPAAEPRVELVALPLPRVDGAESTNDVPDDDRELHWKAFDGLAAPFAEFLGGACADETTRPHWIIADSFHHWGRRRPRAPGSEVPLRVEQVHELAFGLELAGTRFLWALRKPSGAAVQDDDGVDMLPPGFQKRTRGQGLVTTGWVPQVSILAHAAVGGFLTHCGRNSLIEDLMFGHPLVMLPIFGDQGPNARQMEAKKVGLQVTRNEDDGSFDRHGVASAVRAVMVDEEARRGFVAGAAKMQAVVADTELHDRSIDEFVQHLRSYAASSAI